RYRIGRSAVLSFAAADRLEDREGTGNDRRRRRASMQLLKRLGVCGNCSLFLALLSVVPVVARADNDNIAGVPPFDFSNAFYLQNGINPANILDRVNGTCPGSDMPACSVVDNSNTDPDHRNVRVLSTTGGSNPPSNTPH